MAEPLYPAESQAIVAACSKVYSELGSGFDKPLYAKCLAIELEAQRTPFEAEREVRIQYKGKVLEPAFRVDFICHGRIIVQVEAAREVTDDHRARLLSHLRATGLKLGLLVNFGHAGRLEYERFAASGG